MPKGISKDRRTIDNLIKERIGLLWDFGICNRLNEGDIRCEMRMAIENSPEIDPDRVLERITSRMINTYNWEN
jgi:hypothetical protein